MVILEVNLLNYNIKCQLFINRTLDIYFSENLWTNPAASYQIWYGLMDLFLQDGLSWNGLIHKHYFGSEIN